MLQKKVFCELNVRVSKNWDPRQFLCLSRGTYDIDLYAAEHNRAFSPEQKQ